MPSSVATALCRSAGIAAFLGLVTCLAMAGCPPGELVTGGPSGGDCDDDAADDDLADDDVGQDNQPPTAPVVAIEPPEPEGGDDLTCVIVEPSTDPDGDDVTYSYAWTTHGSPTNLTSDTVPDEYTGEGEEWICTVVPGDGQAEGPPAVASATIGINVFEQVQSLSGVPSSLVCEECDYTFDVTYTTVSVAGTCATSCWVLFDDGTYPMAYSSVAGMIMLYRADYYGGYVWYPWYYATLNGSHIEFIWDGYGYTSSGYWDIDGDTMTGQAVNAEP